MWLEIKTWSYLELSASKKREKYFYFFFPTTCSYVKPAKLRALRSKNVLTCQHALRAYVSTCHACLRANVSTCLTCLHAYVPTCLACSRAYVPTRLAYLRACVSSVLTCLCANVSCVLTRSLTWVPCLIRLALPCDHLPTCFVSSVSSFDVTFCSFTAIVIGVVHTQLYIDLPVGSI